MLKKIVSFFPAYLFGIFPLLIFTGPFLPDLASVILGIFFLYICFNKKKLKYYFYNKIVGVIILLNCLLLLSSFFSDYTKYSLSTSIFYFRHLLFALAISYILKNYKSALNYFNITLYLCLLIGSIDCYVQFLFGKNLIGLESNNNYRLGSFFGEELIIGSYLARLFPFYLAIITLSSRDKKYQIVDIIIFVLIGGAIYLSGERTAFALYLLSCSFFILYNNVKLSFKIFTTLIILIVALNILFPKIYSKQIEHTKNQIFQENRLTFFSSDHEGLYESAYKMFLNKPLLGQGPRTFRLLCDKDNFQIIKPGAQSCSSHPHNTYFQLLAEVGFIFFSIVLFIFIFVSYYLALMILDVIKSNHKKNVSYYYLVAIFINFFPFVPSGNFFNNWINILYYLPLGFVFYFYSNKLFKKNVN